MATNSPFEFVAGEDGALKVTTYATDSAGNDPVMFCSLPCEFASFSLSQAKAFRAKLDEAIAYMEK